MISELDAMEIIYLILAAIISAAITYIMIKGFVPDCYDCGNRKSCSCLRNFKDDVLCGTSSCPLRGEKNDVK